MNGLHEMPAKTAASAKCTLILIEPIPSLPGYRADTEGNVYGKHGTKKPLKGWVSNGYTYVKATVNGKTKTYLKHRLVAEAFHGKCPEGLETDHIDRNRLNCRPDNLQYITHIENIRRRVFKKRGKSNVSIVT